MDMQSPGGIRARVLGQLVELILGFERQHPVRVAIIDGRSGRGRVRLRELAALIRARGAGGDPGFGAMIFTVCGSTSTIGDC
ncbi:MAG: hypothetical protein U0232_06805 [Thermomicrobiales bacterium]